ncbi:protein EFFECTOR OF TRANSCRIPTION 2-like [Tasmannia lanceolata]|uniref:protein EFFECTOR OF TRANSCRIPTION 2-like n=1 Tax=Tasmannia lanceolata TaxID=3420 RepID=UPI0040635FDE
MGRFLVSARDEGKMLRLKGEEDCKQTCHDSPFSKWEILVGPSDWENHSLGEDGTERYRIHRLPEICSHPGLYELGIAAAHTDLGRKINKINSSSVVPIYIGQADNVRMRLQEHGRGSSHLGSGTSTGEHGLFENIFSRGYPILYRWAPMQNKNEAEKTEGWLLETFDYAWKKGGNSIRCPDDILQKLDRTSSGIAQFSIFLEPFNPRNWSPFSVKQEGMKINLTMKDTESNSNDSEHIIGPWAFTFSKSRPRLVSGNWDVINNDDICGVALGDGSICRSRPVDGRKRCGQHEGMRVTGASSRLVIPSVTKDECVSEDYTICGVALGDGAVCRSRPTEGRKRCGEHKEMRVNESFSTSFVPKGDLETTEKHLKEEYSICGVALGDGSLCRSRPIEGRKRCGEHKGMRVNEKFSTSFVPKGDLETTEKHLKEEYSICGVALGDGSLCRSRPIEGRKRCGEHKGMRVNGSFSTSFVPKGNLETTEQHLKEEYSICGVALGEGSLCRSRPIEGRKRCGEHKGMRVFSTSFVPKGNLETKWNHFKEEYTICGVALGNGSVCRSRPIEGRKRCADHKGMRVNVSSSTSFIPKERLVTKGTSGVCGVGLRGGSVCMESPVRGRKRCEQHKGMRV